MPLSLVTPFDQAHERLADDGFDPPPPDKGLLGPMAFVAQHIFRMCTPPRRGSVCRPGCSTR